MQWRFRYTRYIYFRMAVILAFDVKIERDAQEMADSLGVKIFQADIIYHLFDRFTQYQVFYYLFLNLLFHTNVVLLINVPLWGYVNKPDR